MIFCKLLFFLYFMWENGNCLIPGLSVKKVDQRVIDRKRQDTIEMCRIFEEQNNLLQKEKNNTHYRSYQRNKREVHYDENSNLKNEDLKRIENIVDRIYDDVEENGVKVTYRKRIFNTTKEITPFTENIRRFNFAPASILGPDAEVQESKQTLHDPVISKINWIKKWHHGIVPYFIDPNTYDAQLGEVIVKAFDYFEKVTCIRLQRLRERPTDTQSLQNTEWLYISNPSGIRQCVHSNEKKPNNGVQMVVFGYDCMSLGEIAHEVMHVLGFSHEHTRPDRDKYVTILWDNIKPGYKKYFLTRQEDQLLSLPYDYASVLHYPPRAFSKNGQLTIMTQGGIKIGQREALSEIDIQKVSMVYASECFERNKEYLLETCPSVINERPEKRPSATPEEIEEYFKERIWPYGIVNFRIKDDMEFTTEEKENIRAVMQHIEKETCIEFRDLNAYQDSVEDQKHVTKKDEQTTSDVPDEEHHKLSLGSSTHANIRMTYRIRNNTIDSFEAAENEIANADNDIVNNGNVLKGTRRMKRSLISPSRRHAANVLTFVKTSEPGCPCQTPGRPNGHKNLIINSDCFNSANDLLHYFVHILGLDHQHNTYDRDLFLKILWDNLTPEIKLEMSHKLPPAASAGFAYDYQSVMHYPWLQIKDGVTHIMYPIWNDGWAMGHWQGLSFTDVQKLNLIYKEQCSLRGRSV